MLDRNVLDRSQINGSKIRRPIETMPLSGRRYSSIQRLPPFPQADRPDSQVSDSHSNYRGESKAPAIERDFSVSRSLEQHPFLS